MKKKKLTPHEAYDFLVDTLATYKPTQLVNVEITKYVPRKTQAQLGLYWLAFDYFAEHAGYDTAAERKMLHKGIEQQHAFRKETGAVDENGMPVVAPIPLSECNRLEQFGAYLEGLFRQAAAHTPAIDMSEFVDEWNEIRERRKKRAQELVRRTSGERAEGNSNPERSDVQ